MCLQSLDRTQMLSKDHIKKEYSKEMTSESGGGDITLAEEIAQDHKVGEEGISVLV